jgi:CRP-like cAMP-binding protein
MENCAHENPKCLTCINNQGIINGLSDEEKCDLDENKDDFSHKKGDVIFKEGNKAHHLYCLHSGKVKLTKLGKDGKEQIIRFAKSGDIIGYRSLLSNDPYHASAIAMEKSQICVIPKSVFQKTIEHNYKLSLNLIQLLSKDLKSAERHFIDVAQKNVRERICESLLLIIHSFGYLEDGKTINAPLTRAEIGDLAGTTTETTIRTLAQLNTENIIQLEGKKIIILDFKALVNNTSSYD